MWGNLSDDVSYYDSMHYIFDQGDRKTLNTVGDIQKYATKEIRKLTEDSYRLTQFREPVALRKAIATLNQVLSKANSLSRHSDENTGNSKPVRADGLMGLPVQSQADMKGRVDTNTPATHGFVKDAPSWATYHQ